MSADSSSEITQLLQAWADGDRGALDKLIPLVYGELRRLAQHYMALESKGHTLQTTALVNEAFLRLMDQRQVRWQNRAHFYGISAQLMRRVLVDMGRARRYLKRGGGAPHFALDEAATVSQDRDVDLVALDEALQQLAVIDSRKARVVELRFFGGLSVDETAGVLQISTDTVSRDWIAAKAWLYRELSSQ